MQLAQPYYDFGNGRAPGPVATKPFDKAATTLEPLVEKRVLNADWPLMSVNHARGDDTATAARMRTIPKSNPSDESALASLGYVCNDNLFDFKCLPRFECRARENRRTACGQDARSI